jgi:hypothetical protein
MRNDLDKQSIRNLKHSIYARNLLIALPFYILSLVPFILPPGLDESSVN